MATAEYIYDEDFEAKVLKSDKPALVDFTASWCGPCKDLAPILDELATEHPDIKFVKIDVGGNRDTGENDNPVSGKEYGVSAYPTLMLFRDGKVADMFIGAPDKDELLNWVEETLALDTTNDMETKEAAAYSVANLQSIFKVDDNKKKAMRNKFNLSANDVEEGVARIAAIAAAREEAASNKACTDDSCEIPGNDKPQP